MKTQNVRGLRLGFKVLDVCAEYWVFWSHPLGLGTQGKVATQTTRPHNLFFLLLLTADLAFPRGGAGVRLQAGGRWH